MARQALQSGKAYRRLGMPAGRRAYRAGHGDGSPTAPPAPHEPASIRSRLFARAYGLTEVNGASMSHAKKRDHPRRHPAAGRIRQARARTRAPGDRGARSATAGSRSGPVATFYFEMLRDHAGSRCRRCCYIEKGGEAQIADELARLQSADPARASELVATVMFEIDDPVRRAPPAGAPRRRREHRVHQASAARRSRACRRPTRTAPTPRARPRRCSSSTSPSRRAQIARSASRAPGDRSASTIRNYGHMAVMPDAVRAELAEDFD